MEIKVRRVTHLLEGLIIDYDDETRYLWHPRYRQKIKKIMWKRPLSSDHGSNEFIETSPLEEKGKRYLNIFIERFPLEERQ